MADCYDYVIIGSGFGGSVAAHRLTEKGYSVLVLERGKRFADSDFPRTNWDVRRYFWLPALRCFGILQMSLLNGVLVFHGCGVGGGSLGYANVLMEPEAKLFEAPGWRELADWRAVLRPHFAEAKRMLGVATNPCLWDADRTMQAIAAQRGHAKSFAPTPVGVFFGPEGQTVPDPYFGGAGPDRAGCQHCGGCMIGCRHNAKNTLVKNYLYFAERGGAKVRGERLVDGIRPLPEGEPDGARYVVTHRHVTAWFKDTPEQVRARNVVVAAGVLGTLRLLLRCREELGTLPLLSARLGERVYTNSEALLGVTARRDGTAFDRGVAIPSVFAADEGVTHIEPVHYPDGASFMRLIAMPLINRGASFPGRLLGLFSAIARRPMDFLRALVFPHWARRTVIVLAMQTRDTHMRLRLGRNGFTLGRRGLVAVRDRTDTVEAHVPIGIEVVREFARRVDGIPQESLVEGLLNTPTTAHILGGCPMGSDYATGVVDRYGAVHGYPGLFVCDGSIMPGNPGVNPSLTITALAEHVMSAVPPKPL